MKTLTVIIPTWNRDRYLDRNLEILNSYLLRGLNFKILICNNGSTDNTRRVLEKWADNKAVCLINQPENVKFDRNVATGYLNFDTDFCFCLGDSKTVSFESLEKIIKTINEEKIDALVIKTAPNASMPDKYYTEVNELISDLGWILTNVSSCIIPKSFINEERCERYYDSQFIHYGVFIDALCSLKEVKVKYDSSIEKEMISFPDEVQPHGWSSCTCSIFGKIWIAFIMSLPWKVTLETKIKVILDHNKYARFLRPAAFVYAKINRNKDFFRDYKANRIYRDYMKKHCRNRLTWL